MFNFFKKKPQWATHIKKAESLYKSKNYDEAMSAARAAIAELETQSDLPNLGWANFLLGRAAVDAGEYELAFEKLNASLGLFNKIEPKASIDSKLSIYLALSELQKKQGNFEKEVAYYREIIALLPQQPFEQLHLLIYMKLAESSQRLRNYEGAITYFGKYMEAIAVLQGKENSNYHGVGQHKDRLIASLEAKKAGFPSPFVHIKYENGGAAMIDAQYADYLVSQLPEPSIASWTEMLAGVKSMKLIKREWKQIEGESSAEQVENILLDDQDGSVYGEIKPHLALDPDQKLGHVMGNADHFIRLEKTEGEAIDIDFFSPRSIRIHKHWKEDADLVASAALSAFFQTHGVSFAPAQ